MNADVPNNGSPPTATATGLPTRPAPRTAPELIAREAQQTLADLRWTWAQTRADARGAVDVRRWAATHPWLTVGAAAGAGFAVAWLIFRPRRRAAATPTDSPRRGPSLWATLAPHLLPPLAAVAKEALQTALRAAFGQAPAATAGADAAPHDRTAEAPRQGPDA